MSHCSEWLHNDDAAAVEEQQRGTNTTSIRPDGIMLRRSVFDFLQKKNVITQDAIFTGKEANALQCRTKVDGFDGLAGSYTYFDFPTFPSSTQLIFDDKTYTVVQYRENNDGTLVRCDGEKLDIAERMKMVAFPVLRRSCDKPDLEAQADQTISHPDLFDCFPDDCLLRIFSYASCMQDIVPMTSVCKHWRQVLCDNNLADETIWKDLCLCYYPILDQVYRSIEGDGVTWQQLFLDRARHVKTLYRPCSFGTSKKRPFYDKQDSPYTPKEFKSYKNAFIVTIYDESGSPTSMNVGKPVLRDNGEIVLGLPRDISLESCTSLDIFVRQSGESDPFLLYSGAIDVVFPNVCASFKPFNQFEKFRARSFFVGLASDVHYEEKVAPISIPSCQTILEILDNVVSLKIHFYWQYSSEGALMAMSERDVLVFLEKGLTSAGGTPFSLSMTVQPQSNWAMSRFSPRPLTSYGFLVDYLLDVDESLPCAHDIVSRFYELSDIQRTAFGSSSLLFKVPTKCGRMLPTNEFSNTYGARTNHMEVVIYVVDKRTGLQARLYQGRRDAFPNQRPHRRARQVRRQTFLYTTETTCVPDSFAPSSFFSTQKRALDNFGAVPSACGCIHHTSTPPVFELCLKWNYMESSYPLDLVSFQEQEFLTFLEKAMSWGKVPAARRRSTISSTS